MSQSEKRYFKLFVSRFYNSGGEQWIVLFDLMQEMAEYDEVKLKTLVGERFFAQKKKTLEGKVLDSLKSFHRGKNVRSNLSELLAEFKILLNKSMFIHARKKILKAEKLAVKNELFSWVMLIKQAKTELFVATSNTGLLTSHIEGMRMEIPLLVSSIDFSLLIENIYVQFVKVNSERQFVRTSGEFKELNRSANKAFEIDVMEAKSFKSKIQLYYIYGIYYYLLGDFSESLVWFKKQVELFDNEPQLNVEFIYERARALANVSLLSIQCDVYDNDTFEVLKLLSCKTKQLNNYVNYWCFTLTFFRLIKSKEYVEAIEFLLMSSSIKRLEERFESKNIFGTERNIVFLGKIKALMMLGRNGEALNGINTFLNKHESVNELDTYIFARLLFLFVHLDIGNIDVVENGIRSLKRFLVQEERLFEFESSTLVFMSEICGGLKKSEQLVIWKQYQNKILDFKQQRFERNATVNFDISHWIDLKIANFDMFYGRK